MKHAKEEIELAKKELGEILYCRDDDTVNEFIDAFMIGKRNNPSANNQLCLEYSKELKRRREEQPRLEALIKELESLLENSMSNEDVVSLLYEYYNRCMDGVGISESQLINLVFERGLIAGWEE